MADDFEARISKLEHNFEDYMAIMVQWLDELRTDMRDFRAESAERFKQNEILIRRMDDRVRLSEEGLHRVEEGLRDSRELIRAQQLMHGDLLRLLSDFRRRQDDHDDRLSALEPTH